ncbi:hypothetical protein FQ775_11605 [Nitratireductor mangrovi]|uniref:Uncharacterized protein n=1 Tax=Nitratireductor mangrovi TaxID=2599600 RepID=A0A5B8KZ88_9HYPH|nr:hypothetical protein [Nitratireductor mangrovi]QDZ00975.1 hypothetical protein FQ775_11605 [Nitratireductor mangrovi]
MAGEDILFTGKNFNNVFAIDIQDSTAKSLQFRFFESPERVPDEDVSRLCQDYSLLRTEQANGEMTCKSERQTEIETVVEIVTRIYNDYEVQGRFLRMRPPVIKGRPLIDEERRQT